MDQNHLEPDDEEIQVADESINISDVIEVIETDPDFRESTMLSEKVSQQTVPPVKMSLQPHQQSLQIKRRAFVRIIEQPASKALRFRYECEGRSAGSIPGVSSTPENKTFPAIQVVGYKGRAVVVVSCVTKDEPYRPHPHNLVGREGCKKGVCTLEISPDTMSVTFSNLGIQCVKKKDIESALKVREEIKVDPFMTGFSHRSQPTSIDLNAVRLCFQVFLEGDTNGKFSVPLTPVVSEPIYDKKAMSDLVIVKLSHCVSPVDGGRDEIILLCEKVAKEDIQVRFYEEKEGRVVWEGFGDFQPSQVHKQTAICFRPPKYRTLDITEPVKVNIQLRRPSDGASSEPLPFEILPLDSESSNMLKRKRQKYNAESLNPIYNEARVNPYLLNIPMEPIKVEPREKTPSPSYGQVYTVTVGGNVSPHHYQPVSPEYQQPTSPPQMVGGIGPRSYVPSTNIPSVNTILNQNWNIAQPSNATTPDHGGNLLNLQDWNNPAASAATAVAQIQNDLSHAAVAPVSEDGASAGNVSGLSIYLNMDSQQIDVDPGNLSETFTAQLSLTDLGVGFQDQSMTDSLTRMANSAIDKMCQDNL